SVAIEVRRRDRVRVVSNREHRGRESWMGRGGPQTRSGQAEQKKNSSRNGENPGSHGMVHAPAPCFESNGREGDLPRSESTLHSRTRLALSTVIPRVYRSNREGHGSLHAVGTGRGLRQKVASMHLRL